jgi:anaerobic selenocysteine-containing dehydrogenase
VLLLVGTNPVVSHGYGTALPDPQVRLREFRSRGGRVWVLDPCRSETASAADEHLGLHPGTDHLVLAWLVRELLENGADRNELAAYCQPAEVESLRRAVAPFTLREVGAAADVDPATLTRLLSDVRAAPRHLAVLCGTGVTMSRSGLLACWLRWVLLIVTGSLDRPGGMRCNPGLFFGVRRRQSAPPVGPGPASRSELRYWAGQYPCVAMLDEIEAGNLRALVVAGGNPLTAFPGAARTRAALGALDTLAVVDVAESELTALATHVLPAAGQLERADVLVQEAIRLEPGTQYTPAVVPPVAERRPAWWIFAQLARRLAGGPSGGGDILDGLDPDNADDDRLIRNLAEKNGIDAGELVARGPRGLRAIPEYGWVHERVLQEGGFRVAPPEVIARLRLEPLETADLVLTPRREPRSMNSAHYAHASPGRPSRILVHPEDARSRGIADAEPAVVTTAHGRLTATVKLDATLRRGVVSIVHGWDAANVCLLTSSRDGVDALTGMPHTSGVQVELAACIDSTEAGLATS